MKTLRLQLIPKFFSNDKGFTLNELMIALLVSGVIVIIVGSTFIMQRRSATAQEQVAEVQQNIRAAMDIIEREVRMAGYDLRKTAGTGITTAVANNLVFSMLADTDNVDNNGNGTVDETDEIETYSYDLYDAFADGDTDLGRSVGGAARQAVAENIDAIEFLYVLADGTRTLAPGPALLTEIRSIEISILARANQPDPQFNNGRQYIPGSGNAAWDINGAAAGSGNPANDNFRRRLLTTTIQCRNMGL